jgi:Fic family protein
LLREVTEKGNWVDWVMFIVKGVGETAALTLQKINAILQLKLDSEEKIKQALKASYSRELCDLLYSYPYIKIKILEENNIAKRQTASDYLKKLEKAGLLEATKIGKETYYINKGLMAILSK